MPNFTDPEIAYLREENSRLKQELAKKNEVLVDILEATKKARTLDDVMMGIERILKHYE